MTVIVLMQEGMETVRRGVEKARAERDEAMKVLLKAEAAVNESPFAGQTAEQALRDASEPPKVRPDLLPTALLSAALILLSGLAGYLLRQPLVLYAGLGAAIAVCWVLGRRARANARRAALLKRFGTSVQEEIAALADTYVKLLEARDTAQIESS